MSAVNMVALYAKGVSPSSRGRNSPSVADSPKKVRVRSPLDALPAIGKRRDRSLANGRR